MSTVTPLEHTAIGALAGVTEVCIMQVRAAAAGRSLCWVVGAGGWGRDGAPCHACSEAVKQLGLTSLLTRCLQPTVGIKNALQEGRPVPRTLPGLYRGLAVRPAAAATAPAAAVLLPFQQPMLLSLADR